MAKKHFDRKYRPIVTNIKKVASLDPAERILNIILAIVLLVVTISFSITMWIIPFLTMSTITSIQTIILRFVLFAVALCCSITPLVLVYMLADSLWRWTYLGLPIKHWWYYLGGTELPESQYRTVQAWDNWAHANLKESEYIAFEGCIVFKYRDDALLCKLACE